jgi:ABC-type bacteriocin/lantibiotic exporter with double-glycine peptidase domain
MGSFKEFVLSWIIPKDEETLRTWLFIIELFNVILSIFTLALVVLTLTATDVVWVVKFGVMLMFFAIGLATLNLMQYLLQIEFNTRGYIFKRRK